MKLRSLEVAQFRKFDRAIRIGPLADGINVLCGPNEYGKSTLLAAIRGVLFERHTSRAEAVRRMRHHRGETSPRVALSFETAEGLHRIEKRFLHREPFARLTLPDGARLEGDAAEEALQARLGFRAAGKQGARPEDAGMWGALWVTQRELVDQPALAGSARMTLHACLEAEVGVVTGGERGQAMLRDIGEELARLRDGRGQPKGRLKELGDLLARAEADLLRLTEKRRALAEDIEALQRCRRTLAQANGGDEADRLEADLAGARRRRDAVLRYADRHAQAATDLRLAEAAHASGEGESARRAERRRRLAEAERQVAAATAEEQEARTARAAADGELSRAAASLAAAEKAAEAAGVRLSRARLIADVAARAAGAAVLASRLAQAEGAAREVSARAGELAAFRTDAASVQAVRAASLARDHARAVLDAQATAIRLDLEPGASGCVLIDGAAAASGEVRAIAEVAIVIPGVGRIAIRPAIKDRETLLAAIEGAERTLAQALRAASAADVAEAEKLLARRMSCEQLLREARRALDLYAPADPARGLKAGADALRGHVASTESRLAAELAALGLTEPPCVAAAEAALADASRANAEAADARALAGALMPGPRQRQAEHAELAARTEALRKAAEAERERLRHETEVAAARESDEAVAGRLRAAARDVIARQAAVALVEQARPEDTLAAMDARIARLTQAIDATRERDRKLRQDIAVLQSRIQQEEGGGIEEQIAVAERLREALAAERDALAREAEMLVLLRDTLQEAERAAKERYLAPVVRRMTPYLQGLFPGACLSCDGDFRIAGLMRDGDVREEFARLSDGTQEQIAILSRLAFADMLIDRGRPAMVILDDALAFADRDRMERMFDLLAQSASRMQILVLTCRGDVFTRLGGHRVEVQPLTETAGAGQGGIA